MTPSPCPFCHPHPDSVFHADDQVLGLGDSFPASPGHALLVPRRHIPDWFSADAELQTVLTRAIETAKKEIEKTHRPDGYNIGLNVGAAAGQTVFHLHVHVIPRYAGDVADPRGGIRYAIPHDGLLQRLQFLCQLRMSSHRLTQPRESAHDVDAHLHGSRTVKDSGGHEGAVLGEGNGRVLAVRPTTCV